MNIELIINLGKPHRVLDKHNAAQHKVHTAAWVPGLQPGRKARVLHLSDAPQHSVIYPHP